MNNIKLFGACFLLSTALFSMDDIQRSTTIFAPAPLITLHYKNQWKTSCLQTLKNNALPLSCCFFYMLYKDNVWHDVTKNPLTTISMAYILAHYSNYLMLQAEQQKIDQEIMDMMQHIFHLLIIGHGIYNKIITPSYDAYKTMLMMNVLNLDTLDLFLNNAYHTWFILFSYYQEHYDSHPLYMYNMEEIDSFEVLQAAQYEPDVIPFIINFYNKNNTIHDCQAILNCLEIKLKLINHKLGKIMPTEAS